MAAEPAERAVTRMRLRIVGWCAVWLLGLMLLLLVGPPMSLGQQNALCVNSFSFSKWLRLVVVCDTGDYLQLAGDPAGLFEPDNQRQSRPGFVALAWLLAWVFKPVGLLATALLPADLGPVARKPDKLAYALGHLIPAYLAYVTINVAVLLGTVWTGLRMLPRAGRGDPRLRAMLVCVFALLLGNDVVKAFVWSAHTQMLNIAVPVVAVGLMLRPMPARRALAAAAAIGLAMLVYADVTIAFAGLCVAVLRQGGRRWWVLAWCVGLFVAPSLAWAEAVRLVNGAYYVVEVAKYHEFVWITEAWRAGGAAFVAAVAADVWFFASNAALQALPALGLLLYAGLRVARADGAGAVWSRVRPGAVAAGLACLFGVGFFAVVGWQAARLCFAAVPPLVWLVALCVVQAEALTAGFWTRRDAAVFGVVAGLQSYWVVLKDGPLS